MSFVRRLGAAVALLLFIFVASRGLIRLLPGDPLETLMEESGTRIPEAELRAELGLDRPYLQAAWQDLGRLAHGDFGRSLLTLRPIGPPLQKSLRATLLLALAAMALGTALAIAIAAGPAPVCELYGAAMTSLPMPWIAPALIYLLAVKLPFFSLEDSVALPAFCLALGFSGHWCRIIRYRWRETLANGAAPGARARGLPEWKVRLKYGLAPAAGALLALMGTQFGGMLAGSFVIETVFDRAGMGTLFIDAVLKRDYPAVEAAVFVTATASILGTWIGDALQYGFDPRQRHPSS